MHSSIASFVATVTATVEIVMIATDICTVVATAFVRETPPLAIANAD
jgi:hypothetical protein